MKRYSLPNGISPSFPSSAPKQNGDTKPNPRKSIRTDHSKGSSADPVIADERSASLAKHHDSVVFVRSILSEAITRNASDVHVEPQTDTYRVRFRIDGVLVDFAERPGEEYASLVSAVKVLADLNIAERVIPQDGHIELVLEALEEDDVAQIKQGGRAVVSPKQADRFYDIRISFFPSVNGEVMVFRILNRESALLSVEELGMDSVSLERLRNVLLTSYGMMLITGPTGSGKTTTLYSLMNELKSDEKNIITLEDPIEFHLPWMRQCEIREERGFTFERAMASVLRQDPDVLMVGEIRDPATAEYAVRSALVGRIVGSTLHANTAIGTIARLLDLGVPRSLVAHSIQAVIAQRLVRRICDTCKEVYTPSPAHLAHFGLDGTPEPLYKGKGCSACRGTGYRGRIGIFSVMVFSEEIRNLIFEEHALAEIQDVAIQEGMRTLKIDAAMKIHAGITTAEEAIRAV